MRVTGAGGKRPRRRCWRDGEYGPEEWAESSAPGPLSVRFDERMTTEASEANECDAQAHYLHTRVNLWLRNDQLGVEVRRRI